MIIKLETSASIKSGDNVWIGNNYGDTERIVTVERVTPSQIVISKDERYWRAGNNAGWQVGGAGMFNHARITKLATADEVKAYQRSRLLAIKKMNERERLINIAQSWAAELQEHVPYEGVSVQLSNLVETANGQSPEFSVTFHGLGFKTAKKLLLIKQLQKL